MNQVQKKLSKEIPHTYLKKCVNFIITRANTYLFMTNVDGSIISDIESKWEIQPIRNNQITLVNTSDKAVYLEFGVGVVGQKQSHPNSEITNYQYNVPSHSKTKVGSWAFYVDESRGIDIVAGLYSVIAKDNGKTVAVTKGSPSQMYLYNAMMDLISTGEYKKLWEETLNETL